MEQYVKQPPKTERQIEWEQERLFQESGPFYHLSTKPLENGLIFENDEDRRVALNLIALATKEYRIEILAYALMSNHFHFIIRGELVDGLAFFERLKKRLSNYFSRRGRADVLDSVHMDPDTPAIKNLTQLRNEIAYVIRNPYVVRVDVNPLAYVWCSGFLYFNPFLSSLISKTPNQLTYKEKKDITRSPYPDLDPSFRIRGQMIAPESFVNFRLVERLFPNARKFTWWVFKNMEAQWEVSQMMGERPNLNDDELFKTAQQICRAEFHFENMSELPHQKRKELAIILKNKWMASNNQIARITRLDQWVVDSMFPLTAKQNR